MNRAAIVTSCLCCTILISLPSSSQSAPLTPYRASPDQVLVIYNADWPRCSEGTTAGNDSLEVAEYYVRRHTDKKTGKKPYTLGLSCRHLLGSHLNEPFIRESSNDNSNGIIYTGIGANPSQTMWLRDSRSVELKLDGDDIDWDSVRIACRSDATGETVAVTPPQHGLRVSGIPATPGGSADYPPVPVAGGRTYRFDASVIWKGAVTVSMTAKNRKGDIIRDRSLPYHDIRDFTFTPVGADGIPDDAVVEEDLLQPVRAFLTDPRNALPDGTLLRDHVLYIVVVHGVPYAGKAVFGIEHGATENPRDHGTLASMEQRFQSLFYPWDRFRPPLVSFYLTGGPDADNGVVNHIITTAMRHPQGGIRWNPYMHPDTYSFLRRPPTKPEFLALPPFGDQRRSSPWFAYAVSRIDGETAEEAKRLIDYAVYASTYLRPELDCRVRKTLHSQGKREIDDLPERLIRSENAWGKDELEILGFGRTSDFSAEGLPFLPRTPDDGTGGCADPADWKTSGFYPGGIERRVTSSNGLNYKKADIWTHISQGVTASAAGAPASAGGPHITNTTFWDNRILLKYLLRGRDLGESFLRSTMHVNWSTSLIGDPLLHPDLARTILDRTPPKAAGNATVTFAAGISSASATVAVDLADDPERPEVALLAVTAREEGGTLTRAVSPLYSRRPRATIEGLKAGRKYTFALQLIDPYGNTTDLPPLPGASSGIDLGKTLIKRLLHGTGTK